MAARRGGLLAALLPALAGRAGQFHATRVELAGSRQLERRAMAWHALVLAVLAGLASFTVVGADGRDNKRVLIWMYDCNTHTMEALANHSSAFTAVAPPMYAVGFDESGGAKLTDIGSYCADTVHKYLPDKELWAWVESPDSMNKTHCPDCAEDAVMRELFARPEAYIASAKMEATKHNLTGFQFDFEAPGQAVNANKTMWLATLRFHEQFAAALSAQGVLTSVATMCTANVTGGPYLCRRCLLLATLCLQYSCPLCLHWTSLTCCMGVPHGG